ncbi:MAG: dihydrodipicolinate synthase family protein [Candidatus Korobacteraceae bacterium]
MLLHGIIPPVTTPFTPEGDVYFKKLEYNVDRFCRGPVAGIAVLGSTGEAILLSDQERRDVLRAAREAASPEKVLVAGTGIESAIETLRLTEYAAGLGYDAALIRTPHFYKSHMNRPQNMLAFYRTVADRSPLPVVIYNFPQNTGYDMPTELVAELAEHPNIIGIKESSGSVEKCKAIVDATRHLKATATVTEVQAAVTGRMLQQATAATAGDGGMIPVGALGGRPSSAAVEVVGGLKTRQKEVGFQVLVGAAHRLLPALEVGAVGAILQFACAAPTACFEVFTAHKERAMEIARDKQQRISEAAENVSGGMGVPGTKYAMDLNGYYGGPVRLPLLPLTGDQKAEVERLMMNIRS